MYIDDCVARHRPDHALRHRSTPINLGSSELVTINQLVDIVEEIAGVKLERRYDLDGPEGRPRPQQRQHDDQERLGWEPSIPLKDGLAQTYRWIYDQLATRAAA